MTDFLCENETFTEPAFVRRCENLLPCCSPSSHYMHASISRQTRISPGTCQKHEVELMCEEFRRMSRNFWYICSPQLRGHQHLQMVTNLICEKAVRKWMENSGKMYRDLNKNVDYQFKIIPHSNERDGGGVETAYSSASVSMMCV